MYIPYTGSVPRGRTSPAEEQPKKKVLRMSNKSNLKKRDVMGGGSMPHAHSDACAMVNCPYQTEKPDKQESMKKQSLLSRLFRSISDPQGLGKANKSPRPSPKASPRPSPKSSPGSSSRRRFIRVVRDDEAAGEEYVNPHVKRRYTAGYWEKSQERLTKSASMTEQPRRRSGSCSPPTELPYTVSGHTILKKAWASVDDGDVQFSSSPKRATFSEEVEVVEFEKQETCALISRTCISHERLHDDSDNTDSLVEHACMQAQEDNYQSALINAHSKDCPGSASNACGSPTFKMCVLAELNGEARAGCHELLESAEHSINHALYSLDVISESSSDDEGAATESPPSPDHTVPV